MTITTKVTYDCPSGFYCWNGKNKCIRLKFESNRPYCELFFPFLDDDSNGNVLKCEKCLLAERKARERK